MAGVPSYDNFRVAPSGPGGFAISVPSTEGFDAPAKQVAQMSRATGIAADQQREMILAAQNDANKTRVMEAANQAREAALHLTYDPNEGYTNVQGGDVLPRDGKPLAVDYTERLRGQIDKIGGTLSNDAQRQMFAEQAANVAFGFESAATAHEQKEWHGYELSVAEGARKLSVEAIAKNYNNADVIDGELANLDQAIYTLGKRNGNSANEITAMQQTNRSAALTTAIAGALESGDVHAADALYQRYGKSLTAVDEIKVKGAIEKEVDGRLVMAAADVADGLAPTSIKTVGGEGGKPVPNGRAAALGVYPQLQITSNHRGGLLPGQTHPTYHNSTNAAIDAKPLPGMTFEQYVQGYRAAGYAIIEAKDEVKHPSRWATGPHWHVVLGQPGTGGGAKQEVVQRPATLDEAWAAARTHLMRERPDASPELIRDTRTEVEARWRMHKQSQDASEDQALTGVYQALIGNGGSVASLPASVRAAIPADRLPHVVAYANSVRSMNGQTDPVTYATLVQHPEQLGAMSDSAFMALRPQLSDSDFKSLAKERGTLRSKGEKASSGKNAPGEINREAVNRAVTQRLGSLGLPTEITAKDRGTPVGAHVAGIRLFVDRAVATEQQALGRKMNDVETASFIDRLFVTSVGTPGGLFSGPGRMPVLAVDTKTISRSDRATIIEALAAQGNHAPTDADILAAYYNYAQRKARANDRGRR